jgi:hypothetical protein
VVLVREGRPEQGDQTVARQAADRALVAMDGGHHLLDGAVQQALGLVAVVRKPFALNEVCGLVAQILRDRTRATKT